ncbi:MAG: ECF transporter S component [Chloroflexi bacterium]|nr:ECF transporter S component [Chloroflexota bacterium]
MVVRWIAALAAFVIVILIGMITIGNFGTGIDSENFFDTEGANSFALIGAIALVVAFLVYAGVEYSQTGGITSIASAFDTRTIVLMPIAVAINIILGATVANALKLPIYLDSIGTILVGALAGPVAGALTGMLSNVLWTYVVPPPFQNGPAAAFGIVAVVIGVAAGLAGRAGWLRPRPNRPFGELAIGGLVALVIVIGLGVYAYVRFYAAGFELFNPENSDAVFIVLGWLIVALSAAFVLGFVVLLFVRRDLAVAYVTVAGVGTGLVAALISAPISANVFGGVTGGGTDFLVAAFRQGGADLQTATFQQGVLSDPVDKLVTFFVVYLVLAAMARRTKARFPQGERLLEEGDAPTAEGDGWRGATA